jgi:hypothetical protein
MPPARSASSDRRSNLISSPPQVDKVAAVIDQQLDLAVDALVGVLSARQPEMVSHRDASGTRFQRV